MHELAEKGVRMFILDNMTILNRKSGNEKFAEQERIITALNQFKIESGAHILLVAHQAKHDTRVSGLSLQEDLADTVLRYLRIKPDNRKEVSGWLSSSKLPESAKQNISALLLTEKIRDNGTEYPALLTWDDERGACIEVSSNIKAAEYEHAGYWVKHIEKGASAPRLPYKYDFNN